MECFCGSERKEVLQDIENRFNGYSVVIKDVPIFICGNGHYYVPRKIKELIEDLIDVSNTNKDTIYHWIGNN